MATIRTQNRFGIDGLERSFGDLSIRDLKTGKKYAEELAIENPIDFKRIIEADRRAMLGGLAGMASLGGSLDQYQALCRNQQLRTSGDLADAYTYAREIATTSSEPVPMGEKKPKTFLDELQSEIDEWLNK